MLKVTVHNEPDLVLFELSGEMVAGELDELLAYYGLLSNFPNKRYAIVDLSDVRRIDDAGRALLTTMCNEEAELVWNGQNHSLDEILLFLTPSGRPAEAEPRALPSFRNILVPTDLSPSSLIALPYAETIAKRYHAHVFVAYVVPPEALSHVPVESRDVVLEKTGAAVITQVSEAVPFSQAVTHDVIVDHGDVVPILSDIVRRHSIDLIIISTHGRRGAQKLLMGSVTEEIFRFSDRPVLTVGPQTHHPREGSLGCILHATDFSAHSERALDYSVSLAKEHQARLLILHVSQSASRVSPGARERASGLITQRLRETVSSRQSTDVDITVLAEFGSVPDRILEVADREGVDLIVMGIRGTSRILTRVASHLPGLSAYTVVVDAPCPVLTIRDPAQAASQTEDLQKAA